MRGMSNSRRLVPAVWCVLVLAACTSTPSPTATPSASQPTATESPTVPGQSANPTPNATAAALDLPNPGGTCVAAQFDVGAATLIGEPATFDSVHVGIEQPLTNRGANCTLALPKVIGLAGSIGPFTAATVGNLGGESCSNGKCVNIYPTSFSIRAGASVRISINAFWSDAALFGASAAPDCASPLHDISRALFPIATGQIEIDWHPALADVCAPRDFSMTVAGT
jgi:hypothetical protein